MPNFLTFAEIIAAVEISVKDYQSSMQPLVKTIINQVYLNEILQVDNLYPLHWLYAPITEKLHASKTITNISVAAAGVVTSAAHGFVGGEVIAIWDVSGMTQINYDYNRYISNIQLYQVNSTGIAANTFTMLDLWGNAVDTLLYTPYTSGGTIIHHGWSVAGAVADMIRSITDIGIHDGSPLTPIPWKELIESPDTYISNTTTTPDRFLHFQTFTTTGTANNFALIFPGNQLDKMAYLMIEATGERLSAAADVPLLPPQFHDTIISGCITRLAENNVQVENAVVWPSLYKMQLDSLKNFNRKWWEQHNVMGKPYLL
jgi:hypothetical protein